MTETGENSGDKIPVKFVTKLPKYSLPDIPIDIPVTVTCKELNSMVNQLLYPDKHPESYVSFDFLIGGELLRVVLKEYLEEKQIGEQVEIEYVEKLPPPHVGDWLNHDDWISSIRALDHNTILSACYDGSVRLWSGDGCLLKHTQAHTTELCAIKGVAWLSDTSSSSKRFVTCSDDGTAVVWRWEAPHSKNNNKGDKEGVVAKEAVCLMPELSQQSPHVARPKRVQCVSVAPDLSHFATGSWDCVINVWSAAAVRSVEESEGESVVKTQGNKRRKVQEGANIRLPVQSIEASGEEQKQAHQAQITSVCWIDNDQVLSSSLDQHVKLWDAKRGAFVSSITTSKAVLSLAYSAANQAFLTASCDRHIRMYDPRITSGGSMVKCSFTSHTGWVSGVAWSANNSHLFMSTSYDCLAKLWDTRSPKAPLYDLCGHGDRILCCDWSVPSLMLSGGVDAKMRIFHYKE